MLLPEISNFYNWFINYYSNSGYSNENGNVLPKVSEILFYHYLEERNIIIKRFKMNYKLILSPCNIIAICGDSSSGKTVLSRIIEDILPIENRLILETDRYHKWERGNENYKTITHLNPYANHLEKMSEDIYKLKIGENIYAIDYNHDTGKFTPLEKIQSATNILFCGLHTLYLDNVNSLLDLKIFMDTDRELSKIWKIKRDVEYRGGDINKVLNNIKQREPDYYKYIETQKNNADIIIKYYLDNYQIKLNMKIKSHLYQNIEPFINEFKEQIKIDIVSNWINLDISPKNVYPILDNGDIIYTELLKHFFKNIIYQRQ